MVSHRLSLRRVLATLRHGGLLVILIALLFGSGVVLLATTPANASAPADIATALPAPPTEEPAPTNPPAVTQAPDPTDPPAPRATDAPAEQPTDPPPPTATKKPERHRDHDNPTSTPLPALPSATPVPTTNIRVRKVVNVEMAQPGETVIYTVVVENTGSSPAYDVVLTDPIPASLDVTDLHSGKGDIVVSGQQVTAYPATLAPGEQVSYTITGRVRDGAAPGTVVNTATVITSTPGDDPGDNTSTATFTIPPPVVIAPPMAIAPPLIFRVPRTADPDDAGLVWTLLPWALLGVLVIGVGGLLAWSIASTRGLTQHLVAFMGPRALTPAADAATATATAPSGPLRPTTTARPVAPVPPLGALFAEPEPLAPLPPAAALDRESVLRPSEESA